MSNSQVRSLSTVSGSESHSMAMCCRRMVAAHVRSLEKVLVIYRMRNSCPLKIRLDLPKVEVRQAESRALLRVV